MATKQKMLSPKAKEALAILKTEGEMTFAELKERIADLNPAHLTALVNRGDATARKVEIEEPVIKKRKVNAYSVADVQDSE